MSYVLEGGQLGNRLAFFVLASGQRWVLGAGSLLIPFDSVVVARQLSKAGGFFLCKTVEQSANGVAPNECNHGKDRAHRCTLVELDRIPQPVHQNIHEHEVDNVTNNHVGCALSCVPHRRLLVVSAEQSGLPSLPSSTATLSEAPPPAGSRDASPAS